MSNKTPIQLNFFNTNYPSEMSEEHTKDIVNAHLLKGISLNFNTRLVQHRSLCHGWTILLENVACLVNSSASVFASFLQALEDLSVQAWLRVDGSGDYFRLK